MRKTLLLVFIHGFKGGDDTFGTFPEHLRALLSHALPNVNVLAVAYPRYETRGELKECVTRFREWLENKVIDLEVANETPSPTVDPSVHTILVGHSMGGIVAAETLLLLANERPILPSSSADNTKSNATQSEVGAHPKPFSPEPVGTMFPHVQGMLAFDTPYLGLAPGMVAHGLEGGHKMASNAYQTYNEVASMFGFGGAAAKSEAGAASTATTPKTPVGALPAPSSAGDAAAAPRWQSWGKYAMFAGAAGAVAAGGAAALYSQREKLSAGWSWAGSHLLFVGDLIKAEHLKQRVERIDKVCNDRNTGAQNFFTNLGRGAREGYGISDQLAGRERTFCNLPVAVKEGRENGSETKKGLRWSKAINEKATDETNAHVSMFFPRDNPGFYELSEAAKETVTSWVDQSWYESSTGSENEEKLNDTINPESVGKDWDGMDHVQDEVDDDEGLNMRDEEKEHLDSDDDVMQGMEGSVIIDKSPTSSAMFNSESKAQKGEMPLPR